MSFSCACYSWGWQTLLSRAVSKLSSESNRDLEMQKHFPKLQKRSEDCPPQKSTGTRCPSVCAQVCVWGSEMGIQGRDPGQMSQCHPPANTTSSSVCSVEVGEQLQSPSIALLAGCSPTHPMVLGAHGV